MEHRQIVGIPLIIAGAVVFVGVFLGWWDWLDLEEGRALGVGLGLMILGGLLARLLRGRR